jgi:hypothetical protein
VNLTLEGATETFLTDFKNPFQKNRIESIWIQIRRKNWSLGGEIVFEATVKFINGNTKGEQVIAGETFAQLIEKVNAFVKSLD